MILKIYIDDRYDQGIDVPVTPQSTVSDIIGCCREPEYNSQCHLVETWRNHGIMAFELHHVYGASQLNCLSWTLKMLHIM